MHNPIHPHNQKAFLYCFVHTIMQLGAVQIGPLHRQDTDGVHSKAEISLQTLNFRTRPTFGEPFRHIYCGVHVWYCV